LENKQKKSFAQELKILKNQINDLIIDVKPIESKQIAGFGRDLV